MSFIMSIIFPLAIILLLFLFVFGGVSYAHLENVFGIFIPYVAIAIFLIGFIYRILDWAKSPEVDSALLYWPSPGRQF